MILTYFGHSALQIETNGVTLLIDPFITGNPHAEGIVEAGALSPDVILLTHAHGDHWGDTPEIAQRSGAHVVANYEIVQYLIREHGHDNATGMNIGGGATFPWGRAEQTLAWHSSSFPDGTYGGNPNGYLLHIEERVVYHAGDTAVFSEMAWLGDERPIDVAFIPVGDCFTMGPKEALRAADMIGARMYVPIHYNTFPPIQVDIDAWAAAMKDAGHACRVLTAGETLAL